MRWEFHQPVRESMRVSTLASGDSKFGGETTLPSAEFKSQ